jgi:putative ATP-dependent endonuclease of OLD family
VPLASIRRFYRLGNEIRVGRVAPGSLTPEEARKVEYHVRTSRGDLLFARVWLLVEGESEHWAYAETASALGIDLDRLGARIVAYQHIGVEPLLKIARDLGILWFLAPDGDAAGKKAYAIGHRYLQGDSETARIAVLSAANIELLLCTVGAGATYAAHISAQKAAAITVKPTDPRYWIQVLASQDGEPKPLKVLEAMASLRKAGTLPSELGRVVTAVQTLCQR